MGTTWKTLEDPRTIITRPGTKLIRFHSFMKYSFLGIYPEAGKGRNPPKTRLITWTDGKVALEECRRHQMARERSGGSAAVRWAPPAPHVSPVGLAPLPGGSPFMWRPPTDLYDASWPLFHVGLIWGLRFIPLGYISTGRPPWENHLIIIHHCSVQGSPSKG
jgi:hypothetical protein